MFCGWGEGRGSGGLREKEAASIRSSPESPPKGVLRLEWGHPLPCLWGRGVRAESHTIWESASPVS